MKLEQPLIKKPEEQAFEIQIMKAVWEHISRVRKLSNAPEREIIGFL